MTVCSGCGLHFCEGQCFTECESDYPQEGTPMERFQAAVDRAVKLQGEPYSELKRTGTGGWL